MEELDGSVDIDPIHTSSKFVPWREERLLAILRKGGTIRLATSSIGVHIDTFHNWMQQSKNLEKKREAGEELDAFEKRMVEFRKNVSDARLAASEYVLENLNDIMKGRGTSASAAVNAAKLVMERGGMRDFFKTVEEETIEKVGSGNNAVQLTQIRFIPLPPPQDEVIDVQISDGTD